MDRDDECVCIQCSLAEIAAVSVLSAVPARRVCPNRAHRHTRSAELSLSHSPTLSLSPPPLPPRRRVCARVGVRRSLPAMVFASSPSSFSSLRPPLLRLARLGTSFPIEVIVTVFCAVTLVYFQLLKASLPPLPLAL